MGSTRLLRSKSSLTQSCSAKLGRSCGAASRDFGVSMRKFGAFEPAAPIARGKPGFPREPPRCVHALPAKDDYLSIPAVASRARHVGRGDEVTELAQLSD